LQGNDGVNTKELGNEKRGRAETVDTYIPQFEWTDDDGFVIFEAPNKLENSDPHLESTPNYCVDGSTENINQFSTAKYLCQLTGLI